MEVSTSADGHFSGVGNSLGTLTAAVSKGPPLLYVFITVMMSKLRNPNFYN